MPEELQTLLSEIGRRVVPTPAERRKMEELSRTFLERTQETIEVAGLDGIASLQGSMAKDTWLHGQADLDIFVQFPPSVERSEWTDRVLPLLRKEFSDYKIIERYAEHPFLELVTKDNVRVNVVPCYKVEKGKWLSATDRTPYHKEFMNSRLTEETRLQARLLKRFSMGIGVYGAEIKVGGFSGMLVETLAVYYKSFPQLLATAGQWKTGTVIDVEGVYEGRLGDVRKKFQNNDLVVVDPVDPERNLAAALRPERLWSFVAASRAFLERPNRQFFYPARLSPRTKAEIIKRMRLSGSDVLSVSFQHQEMVPDILWGQLYRLEGTLRELLERHEFRVIRSTTWSDEDKRSVLLYELHMASLPPMVVRQGPPVERMTESKPFITKHTNAEDTVRGPWIEEGRWMVEKRREFNSADELLRAAVGGRKMNISLPSHLEPGLRKKARYDLNEEIVQRVGTDPGFREALWTFIEGKPRWLKAS
jgi:tRNA nucleotidyltransferase (CCA-adding enzyme)